MQRLRKQHYRRYIRRLRQVLLRCPTLDNSTLREAFKSDLPEQIRHQLNSKLGRSVEIVDDLIKTCANYANGETALFDTLNIHEQNSLSYQKARAEWAQIAVELAVQERLIGWVRASNVGEDARARLFEQVTPADYVFTYSQFSAENIIAALWEVPSGHLPLLRFMRALQSQPDIDPHLQQQIGAWITRVQAGEIDALRYDDPATGMSSSIDDKVRIVVSIKTGKQDPTSRLVKMWVLSDGSLESLDEYIFPANRLERETITEIKYALTSYTATEAVEFYLPKALLTLPIDTWQVGHGQLQQPLATRHYVLKAPLERQDAIQKRFELERLPFRQKRALLKTLEDKPLLLEMIGRNAQWKARWQQLHDAIGRSFEEIAVLLAEPEQMIISAEKGCATLTFVPTDIDSYDLEDPLGVLMAEGVPLIVWLSRGDDDEATPEQIQKLLYDDQCACIITTATDVVERMHQLHEQVVAAGADAPAIGRNLNLIVDNPERELPTTGRVTM